MSAKRRLTCIALIPARAGSTRIPDKNIRPFAGHPLIAYAINAAAGSKIFSDIVVSTDSRCYADIAMYYGAGVPFLRPKRIAGNHSMDIEWITFTLEKLSEAGKEYDCFSIIRPTSPFRLPQTIKRAWNEFLGENDVDSLRAVEKCTQHPGKMWVIRGKRMYPLLPCGPEKQPWHSSPTQSLPPVYVQNASLEIAWTSVPREKGSIAGDIVIPFLTRGYEGFDINNPYDWKYAEELARSGQAVLPKILKAPYLSENSHHSDVGD